MSKKIKKIYVKIISPFEGYAYNYKDIEEYLKEVYKVRGITQITKLFDGKMVAIIKKIEPPQASEIDDATEINVERPKKQKIFLSYIL